MCLVEPIVYTELVEIFPDRVGWEKIIPTGEMMTAPYKHSTAKATYTKDDARVTITIVDGGFSPAMTQPYANLMSKNWRQETASGYERYNEVKGNPGWERYDKERYSGEVAAVINARFLVRFEGENLKDMEVLTDFVEDTNLDKLGKYNDKVRNDGMAEGDYGEEPVYDRANGTVDGANSR